MVLFDGAPGTWFWVDPTNDIVFIGMSQRMNRGYPMCNALAVSLSTGLCSTHLNSRSDQGCPSTSGWIRKINRIPATANMRNAAS